MANLSLFKEEEIKPSNAQAVEKIEIHKRNELVRGSIGEVSIHAAKLLNALYYLVQKNKLYEEGWQHTTFKELRRLMRLETTNTYTEIIKEALTDLAKPIPLNNYTDYTGKKYAFKLMKFLDDARVAKESEWKVEFKIYPDMLEIMKIQQQEGNFTKVDLYRLLNAFRSKYTMKFYEYIISFRPLGTLTLTLDTLRTIFNSDKAFSEILRIVARCEKEILEKDPQIGIINKNIDKKAKTIVYRFSKPENKLEQKKETLKQFILSVKQKFLGIAFVAPKKVGLNYKPFVLFSIDEGTKLVKNDFSNTIVEASQAEEVFEKLYNNQHALGDTKIKAEDYIGEKIIVERNTKDVLGNIQTVNEEYEIMEIQTMDNGKRKLKLKDEQGRVGWSKKEYENEAALIKAFDARLK